MYLDRKGCFEKNFAHYLEEFSRTLGGIIVDVEEDVEEHGPAPAGTTDLVTKQRDQAA